MGYLGFRGRPWRRRVETEPGPQPLVSRPRQRQFLSKELAPKCAGHGMRERNSRDRLHAGILVSPPPAVLQVLGMPCPKGRGSKTGPDATPKRMIRTPGGGCTTEGRFVHDCPSQPPFRSLTFSKVGPGVMDRQPKNRQFTKKIHYLGLIHSWLHPALFPRRALPPHHCPLNLNLHCPYWPSRFVLTRTVRRI